MRESARNALLELKIVEKGELICKTRGVFPDGILSFWDYH